MCLFIKALFVSNKWEPDDESLGESINDVTATNFPMGSENKELIISIFYEMCRQTQFLKFNTGVYCGDKHNLLNLIQASIVIRGS